MIGVQCGLPGIDTTVETAPTLVRECVPAYQRGVTEMGRACASKHHRQRPRATRTSTRSTCTPATSERRDGDRAREELHLCRPRWFVGFDGEHTVVEANRSNMSRHGGSDRVVPPSEHAADLDPVGAAQRFHDPVERFRDRHRIGHDAANLLAARSHPRAMSEPHRIPTTSLIAQASSTWPACTRRIRSARAAGGSSLAVVMITWPLGR